MLLISNMKAALLLALVIVTCIGPTAAPQQNDEGDDDEVSVAEVELEDLDQPDGLQVKSKKSSDEMFGGDCPFDESDQATDYSESDVNTKRMIHLPWGKGRRGKSQHANSQYCCVSVAPTKRQGSTADRRSSTTCPFRPKPTAPAKMCRPPPPPPQPIPKPSPSTPKPPPPTKSCPKQKSRTLSAKTAKMLLKIILDTKQHVLFALEILNHMENEVLTHAPDNCSAQECKRKRKGKGRAAAPKMKPAKLVKFPSYSDSHRKSSSFVAMAREEQIRQKEHHDRINSEDYWYPPAMSQAASRMESLLESALNPMGLNRNGYNKYQNQGQKKQQRKMKISPGMVPILT